MRNSKLMFMIICEKKKTNKIKAEESQQQPERDSSNWKQQDITTGNKSLTRLIHIFFRFIWFFFIHFVKT